MVINFPWLAYSEVNNGAYCKYCVTFTKNEADVNNQKLGAFVLKKKKMIGNMHRKTLKCWLFFLTPPPRANLNVRHWLQYTNEFLN